MKEGTPNGEGERDCRAALSERPFQGTVGTSKTIRRVHHFLRFSLEENALIQLYFTPPRNRLEQFKLASVRIRMPERTEEIST